MPDQAIDSNVPSWQKLEALRPRRINSGRSSEFSNWPHRDRGGAIWIADNAFLRCDRCKMSASASCWQFLHSECGDDVEHHTSCHDE